MVATFDSVSSQASEWAPVYGRPTASSSDGIDGRKPAVSAHRIDQIEDEQRIAPLQSMKMIEVEFDGDDLGDEAELGERGRDGLGADQRIDLVWAVLRRGMHDGDEAAWLQRHQARLRARSVPGRARP